MKHGLLEDDAQWDAALAEATVSDAPKSLRNLFAVLLQTCELSGPLSSMEQISE